MLSFLISFIVKAKNCLDLKISAIYANVYCLKGLLQL
jgi:hypothetical protein